MNYVYCDTIDMARKQPRGTLVVVPGDIVFEIPAAKQHFFVGLVAVEQYGPAAASLLRVVHNLKPTVDNTLQIYSHSSHVLFIALPAIVGTSPYQLAQQVAQHLEQALLVQSQPPNPDALIAASVNSVTFPGFPPQRIHRDSIVTMVVSPELLAGSGLPTERANCLLERLKTSRLLLSALPAESD